MDIQNFLKKTKDKQFLSLVLFRGGIAVALFAVAILLLHFYPIIKEEFKYRFFRPDENLEVLLSTDASKTSKVEPYIQPVDENFSIVIPKIGANSIVISDVDPFNTQEYTKALEKGIAHAKGSAYPGQKGNTFLFAHSAVNFYEARKINVNFYLLTKLDIDDDIYIVYKGVKYHYKVQAHRIIKPNEVEYLTNQNQQLSVLTLMTCYPPGVNIDRFIIQAKIVE